LLSVFITYHIVYKLSGSGTKKLSSRKQNRNDVCNVVVHFDIIQIAFLLTYCLRFDSMPKAKCESVSSDMV